MTFELISQSAQQTHAIGMTMGQTLHQGDTVFLIGDLGAGKTTLVRGICQGAGVIDLTEVRSPSFNVVLDYQGEKPVRHVDLYRIGSLDEFETVGVFDDDQGRITLIEWADHLPEDEVESPIVVRLDDLGEEQRRIIIAGPDRITEKLHELR
jgi:tRNA threonylcarbamoyladenosine biosynthesis protein TsaE